MKEFKSPPKFNSITSKANKKNFIFTELDEIQKNKNILNLDDLSSAEKRKNIIRESHAEIGEF